MPADQLDLPVDPDELFATDETIDRRLVQLENGLADLEARIPAMRREVAVVRRWLVRDEIREAQGSSEMGANRGSGNAAPD